MRHHRRRTSRSIPLGGEARRTHDRRTRRIPLAVKGGYDLLNQTPTTSARMGSTSIASRPMALTRSSPASRSPTSSGHPGPIQRFRLASSPSTAVVALVDRGLRFTSIAKGRPQAATSLTRPRTSRIYWIDEPPGKVSVEAHLRADRGGLHAIRTPFTESMGNVPMILDGREVEPDSREGPVALEPARKADEHWSSNRRRCPRTKRLSARSGRSPWPCSSEMVYATASSARKNAVYLWKGRLASRRWDREPAACR